MIFNCLLLASSRAFDYVIIASFFKSFFFWRLTSDYLHYMTIHNTAQTKFMQIVFDIFCKHIKYSKTRALFNQCDLCVKRLIWCESDEKNVYKTLITAHLRTHIYASAHFVKSFFFRVVIFKQSKMFSMLCMYCLW